MSFPLSPVAQAEQLVRSGRHAPAIELLKKHLQREPRDAAANHLCAVALSSTGQVDAAMFFAERAVASQPGSATYQNMLGVLLIQRAKFAAAIKPLRRATELAPDYAEAFSNLGVAMAEGGERAQAQAMFERAMALKPDDHRLLLSFGRYLRDCGRVDLAVPLFRRATAIVPNMPGAWTSLAAAINYLNDHSEAEVFEVHRRLGQAIMRSTPPGEPRYARSFEPERPLRVGFVSGDFRQHSVADFFEPILDHLDRTAFEVTLYDSTRHRDERTRSIRGRAAHSRDVESLGDDELARQILADGIDVLVDLGGWTATSRVESFRFRAAPVQVTYLGYPATTGLPTVSHRIVDSATDPAGAEAFCVEKLVRIDPCFLCYRMPRGLPDVGPRQDGPVTFCSFNSIMKIGPRVAQVWTQILREVPGSRLLLKAIGVSDDHSRRLFLRQFEDAGCDMSRVEVLGYTSTRAEHLATYARADIGLDPFPYHGTTTTCEAMCMGVPVVTLAGQTHVMRVGVSLLRAVGMEELVAASVPEYVAAAVRLAGDAPRRAALRAGLRARVAASPLCDEASFATRFGGAIRAAWRERCARPASPYLV